MANILAINIITVNPQYVIVTAMPYTHTHTQFIGLCCVSNCPGIPVGKRPTQLQELCHPPILKVL